MTYIKYLRLLFLTIFLAALAGCGKAPIADFSWEPVQPKAGQPVTFKNLSVNARSYSWNFGDMSIGSEANPTHVYTRPGNYIVDLRASKGIGSDEKTVTIVVTE